MLTLRNVVKTLLIAILIALPSGIHSPPQHALGANGVTRTYYIAADEVEWNYAPAGVNEITGEPFGEDENVFVEHGPSRIGSTYLKSLYREYTDDTFTTLKERAPEWEHLGLLGPVIRAEVGDTIEVVFKNNTPYPISVHPHGVRYKKDSEGTPYDDGTTDAEKADDAVPTGAVHTYTWEVPDRAGPGPNDPSSVVWLYHSHTHEQEDTNAGLIGPIIVTAKGHARADGTPKDVDREFVMLYKIFDENASSYLDENIETYTENHEGDDEGTETHEEFEESNLMHTINGYVYSKLPGLTMQEGEHVRWYMVSLGNEVDLHTPHWHGNTGLWNGNRIDVIDILPAMLETVDMTPDAPGVWMFHCHVDDHMNAGMVTLYTVEPAG